ncbi:hypothetical protein T05_8622 [Trichinella murrelli]|uniref:Uncharacterized protein n=1 Tax=Trichinella murrelli TaxID=144512 RepID=A0A0V0TD62_9BILA|nr:hypothetical protein T05_8622 [Trichinella murrelli]
MASKVGMLPILIHRNTQLGTSAIRFLYFTNHFRSTDTNIRLRRVLKQSPNASWSHRSVRRGASLFKTISQTI